MIEKQWYFLLSTVDIGFSRYICYQIHRTFLLFRLQTNGSLCIGFAVGIVIDYDLSSFSSKYTSPLLKAKKVGDLKSAQMKTFPQYF